MSQGPLCPNLTQKVQKEVSQMANRNLLCVMLYGGLSVNFKPPKNLKHVVPIFTNKSELSCLSEMVWSIITWWLAM